MIFCVIRIFIFFQFLFSYYHWEICSQSQDYFGYLEYTEREHDETDGQLAYYCNPIIYQYVFCLLKMPSFQNVTLWFKIFSSFSP